MLSAHSETLHGPKHWYTTAASNNCLSAADTQALLDLARRCVALALDGKLPLQPVVEHYPASIQRQGATFVTLTAEQKVLGRAGTVQASAPLVVDVCHNAYEVGSHAVIALADMDALVPNSYAPNLGIEVQVVSPVCLLDAGSFEEVAADLQAGTDGVLLQHGDRHATFTPDMWQQWPDPIDFLHALQLKAGLDPQEWPVGLRVATYRLQTLPRIQVKGRGARGSPKAK